MSPSPPFPSPLLPSHSSSSSPHPGIIGEHRPTALHHYPSHQHAGTSAGGDLPNGEYLLHLLRSGSHVQQQPQSNIGNGGGGGGRGGGGSGYEQHSHYGFALPRIGPKGEDIPMTAWDPAVAALGPSHFYPNIGFVGGATGTGDGREVMHGLYPPSPYNMNHVSMGSGWPTHKQKQGFLSPPSAASSSSSPSPSLSSSFDPRLFEGRSGDNTFVPIPGWMPPSLYGGPLGMLQRRPEWHPSPPPSALHHHYQQQQLRGMLIESDMSPNHSNNRATMHVERGPLQQFFGDGAELMKLLQISSKSSVCADPSMDKQTAGPGVIGSSMQKASPAILHGPIGPPKRNDSRMALPADDLLGRFWPAPAVSIGNGSQVKGNENHLKASGSAGGSPPFREKGVNFGSLFPPNESGRCWGDNSADLVEDVESLMMPTFGNWEGRVSPRLGHGSRLYPFVKKGSGLPDNFEYHDGRGLVGGWGGGFLEEVDVGAQQYRQSSGGRGIEHLYDEPTSGLNSNHHDTQHMDCSSKESEPGLHRDITSSRAGAESIRGGGGRRGPGSRLDLGGRRGGRSVIGQWVAVHEKQREREGADIFGLNEGGAESGSEKGGSSAGNSCKEEGVSFAKDGSGSQKCRDDLKRRRGQQQEWRMKTPLTHAQIFSHGLSSVTKTSDFSSSDSHELVNSSYRLFSPLKIRPLALQVDHPGLPSNIMQDSPSIQGSSSLEELTRKNHERGAVDGSERRCGTGDTSSKEDEEELAVPFGGYLDLVDDRETGQRHRCTRPSAHEEVDYETQQEHEHMREFRRHSHRTLAIPSLKPEMRYRSDLQNFTAQMLAMYLSLIPTQEEERKREKCLSHLDQLVAREWPGAILFLFGSCANAFGVCNSDIDVCLSINDEQLSKGDLVLKMAAILRSDNMLNVQALTHARVPIVKFTDATTGISCDICVNNMLAVVNSKLLHDYSQIDVRLRQLAFLVKHWAKRRQVNETYRGTLSSYAYVLMCIHFLQQRKPAILPCLQQMQPTYRVTLGSTDCAYYDQVETLQNFGFDNKETLGELLTSFFEYWAFRHDYNRAVVSVRTGGYLSKDEKEWTRRIGNERHLICIEDPLETVHDLGRVVDRHSIRVLRDEFHRAAKILRHDLNPCSTLFEPFIREKP